MKFYGVFNTDIQGFVPLGTGSTLSTEVGEAKALARSLNAAMKPQFQTYTVVTVIFDPEV